MSMPYFPNEALCITCDQAFNMLLGSIAMEELALSHILNAEGEKLQYVLGTIPGKPHPCVTPDKILEVNRSISELLEKVAYNQMLLKGKLQQVLEARDLHCPKSPECPPISGCPILPSCTSVWVTEKNRMWSSGCAVPWKQRSKNGKGICWQGCSSCILHLCAQHTYFVCFSFRMRACEAGVVRLALKGVHNCKYEDILICESNAADPDLTVHISGCTILAPDNPKAVPSSIQFVLETPNSILLEQAILNLVDNSCEAVIN